ncbi:Asp-tRNA(Asn)/Glu-tRNA(Gln) amidotransferase subunit GatA [Pseudomonadales bacterium]|nr:Asp-tRNA(Asn)/Glu-tRNA(Gln) amidotransferase subunit GatA [Pseudomonadales bacterium]MDA9298719.1 Asp-tRNA(Asn)/Glu-tRNA(Gln) amidotransferase subunit GatA [Pseudomonadales bacterium]MDB4068881.1 Asp-tRNA(Asn)/Glu-tRNA(Gln) amidotransferase subunit GatA [Pseudomonadales bacterium]MDB4151322.1 Asp-tRNA(Asn)/Glu-tRNA(Gln) amidotransferase subunit GatA [Pseudomonadales bacterium]MDB9916931.1 Asp-tRNA(Asn)/Glu-tRNA(Gln) amidotransferase subunit GatA [Pseudomonadales bacterium]
MSDLHHKTISQLLRDLDNKAFSSVELTAHYLDRIERLDPAINSYITVLREPALARAAAMDVARQKGTHPPLAGIPIAHKDIICTQGVRTSAGSRMLDNFIAPYNATLVEQLNDAGVVTLGKTNMDEFAMGSSNENSYYGPVNNPWRADRVPGGSSGGSAASLAAGLCTAATGTDTGGSIRQPAAFCGITGLKPTYGRVSRWGVIAYASSLDQAGPMAQTAEDAAHLLQAMAGFDHRDSTSINQPVPDYLAQINGSIKGLKIGICTEYFDAGLDDDIRTAVMAAAKTLESMGAILSEVSLPNTQHAIPAYYVIAPAECSSNLSRYDGVRFGYRCADPESIEDLYKRSRSEGFGREVKSRIMVGTFALSAGYYEAYYRKAQQIRRLISRDFSQAFDQVDYILGPTTPSTAFKLGEKVDDQVAMYLQDIYTIAVNLAGLPAISIPAGQSQGLPIGLQLIGRHLDEGGLLKVAHNFQQASDWHAQRPDDGQ